MVIQIDRNDENGRRTLLTNIGCRKDNKRNFLNAIVEIKDFIYHNGISLKEANDVLPIEGDLINWNVWDCYDKEK